MVTLRAYSVNKIEDSGKESIITIGEFTTNKKERVKLSSGYLSSEDGKRVISFVGRVPAEKSNGFNSVMFPGGLPAKEINSNNTSPEPVKLRSVLDFCELSLSGLAENDILILLKHDLEELIEITVNR